IPAIVPDVSEAKVIVFASPVTVLDLVVHSASKTNPSEEPPSPYHTPNTSPFLSYNHSEFESNEDSTESDASEAPLSPNSYAATVARWRSKVVARSSSSGSSSSSSIPIPSVEVATTPAVLPTSPVGNTVAPSLMATLPVPHVVCRRTRITMRKSAMGYTPMMTPARSATLRLLRARLSSHSSGSSLPLSNSPSDSSTPDIPVSSPEVSSHSLSDTAHTLSGPLSRRRQQVPAASHPSGALSQVRADLLPPCKRFRGSSVASSQEYSIKDSSEAGTETDIDTDILADIKADITAAITADVEADAKPTIEADVEPVMETDIETYFVAEPEVPDDLPKSNIAKRLDQHEEAIQGMYEHLLDLPALRLKDIEEEQRP
ncbi:hypothetical protein Tco_1462524, partial [Tanacetum coccineum]